MSSKSKKRKAEIRVVESPKTASFLRALSAKNIHKKIALLLFSLLLSLALGEAILRVVYGEKFGKRPGFFVGDDLLGWKPCPNLDHMFYGPDYSIEVKTDREGYRLGALGDVDYGKDLILLCGDSFTFGWGVSSNETFASQLDELLDDASNGRMRVVNLGVGGYGTIQQFDRLRNFLSNHRDSRVVAVIVQHTVNDATDNPGAIGYHAGTWKTATKSVSRSRLHLVNLATYAANALKQTPNQKSESSGEADSRDPYLQDMLWAYERVGRVINLPDYVFVGRKKVPLRGRVSAIETNVQEVLRRKTLTALQKEFMQSSFGYLNDLLVAAGRNETKILHMFIYTDPDWYIESITDLIEKAGGTSDGRVVVLGKVPDGEYEKPVHNDHGGGHYNPEFNGHWATSVLALLRQNRVL